MREQQGSQETEVAQRQFFAISVDLQGVVAVPLPSAFPSSSPSSSSFLSSSPSPYPSPSFHLSLQLRRLR